MALPACRAVHGAGRATPAVYFEPRATTDLLAQEDPITVSEAERGTMRTVGNVRDSDSVGRVVAFTALGISNHRVKPSGREAGALSISVGRTTRVVDVATKIPQRGKRRFGVTVSGQRAARCGPRGAVSECHSGHRVVAFTTSPRA